MSAEEEKDGTGQEPAEQPAAKKPAAKRAAAKKPAAEKPAAEKKAPAEKKAARKPATKKAPARKAPEPVAEEKAPAKEASEPVAAEKAAEQPVPTETKPARRGRGQTAEAAPRRKVVRAHARYVRTSARKARMVCGHLRGKTVGEARAILAFTPREVARDWSKLLESAVANAESNHELLEDDLIIREAYADEGPTIKRFRPRAMGRATPIRKRTSHLTITLTPGS